MKLSKKEVEAVAHIMELASVYKPCMTECDKRLLEDSFDFVGGIFTFLIEAGLLKLQGDNNGNYNRHRKSRKTDDKNGNQRKRCKRVQGTGMDA